MAETKAEEVYQIKDGRGESAFILGPTAVAVLPEEER